VSACLVTRTLSWNYPLTDWLTLPKQFTEKWSSRKPGFRRMGFSRMVARRRSMPDNGAVRNDLKTTTAGEGEMEESSRPSKWMWLVPLVFLFFLVQALIRGAILPALAWLSLLVNGVLVASGVYKRSRALSYLAFAFSLLGLLLLVTSIVRDFYL
jgi:hypothetical protein